VIACPQCGFEAPDDFAFCPKCATALVPAVHEDDPERAVRAGLRIVDALDGMTRPDGTLLQVRVGVNTGEALVRLDVTPAPARASSPATP
jgi:class 3 adenylate cyclase